MISKKTIDEIMMTAKIEEVVGDFVSLKRRGQNWVGVCPFHDDKNPSMYVSPRLGIFNCFVCDTKGNAVHFVMEHEKFSYPEALRYLAKKYNINIEEDAEKTKEQVEEESKKESLLLVNQFAETYFIEQLFDTEDGRNIALSYFKERGYNEATIKKFKLGYNPEGWDTFTQTALKKGYKKEQLITLGLTKESESGKLFDFFHGRVIFPIHSALGKTLGFGARTLKQGEKIAKYFNSPESEVYHKSDILYGFFFAKKAIRTHDNVYLVEGYTDVISMFTAGIENVVASSGTALTKGQIKLIATQTQNITLVYDGDPAGIKASLRGIDMLLESGLNVQTVMLPEGEDPDSFARKTSQEDLKAYFQENSVSFILFKAKMLSKDAGNDPMKRAGMVNEIIQNVADIPDVVARAFYIKECAELFQLSEETLNVQLRKAVWKKHEGAKARKEESGKVESRREEGRKREGTSTSDQVDVVEQLPKQLKLEGDNRLAEIEKNIILLILKYGMFEIDIQEITENGDPFYSKSRIDQYIFDEFHHQQIQFSNPLFQNIYLEYSEVAKTAPHQDVIKSYFSTINDKEIADFVIAHLLNDEPEISEQWLLRFDIVTRNVSNNIHKLNNIVEETILMFKLRVIEQYRKLILREIAENSDEKLEQLMLQKLQSLLKRREEIAKLLGAVVTF
ncbi:MAG: DNA primase [Bacteroidetes bacterium]|nr:DNA primase [Bacteroidota bacterium]MCL2302242.1 DNA primase [Lentimicrobiaceae bacterium]MCL2302322.1 DNA primase [Lentimicrobiaceae bacterium]